LSSQEWQAGLTATFSQSGFTQLSLHGWVTLAGLGLKIMPQIAFDPTVPPFSFAAVKATGKWAGFQVEGIARLEEEGFGWGFTLVGPKNGLIQRVRIRFNLKWFLDEVLEDTFDPSFSLGEVWFRLPLSCCVKQLRGWLRFTKAGFRELGLSLPLPPFQKTGLSLFSLVRFKPDEKTAFLVPTMTYRSPPCVEVYLGLDWNSTTSTIQGIKVYALSFHSQFGNVTVRGLTTFEDIGLVKRPYRETLGLTWKKEGCCGPAKFTFTTYFGDGDLLFGLGEVELGVEMSVAPDATIGLGAEVPVSGNAKLTLSWKAKL